MTRLIHGSVARKVLEHARCSIFVERRRQERMTRLVAYRGCIVGATICTHDAGPRPLLGAPGRSLRQPSATKTRHRRPSRACCRTATTSPLLQSARYLTDGTLCEAETGPGRPPVELGATLGVRQIGAHLG